MRLVILMALLGLVLKAQTDCKSGQEKGTVRIQVIDTTESLTVNCIDLPESLAQALTALTKQGISVTARNLPVSPKPVKVNLTSNADTIFWQIYNILAQTWINAQAVQSTAEARAALELKKAEK